MEHKGKTAVLISCFHYYDNRLFLADEYLKAQGYKTRYLTSDYDTVRKRPFQCHQPDAYQIHTRPYYKNLTLRRILSHRDFALGMYKHLCSLPQAPDMIVAIVPPNFIASYLRKYKRKHPQVKLVIDLYDLWPESFPSGRMKKLLAPVFRVWGLLRDRTLPMADRILTECDMYRQRLGLEQDPRAVTFPLAGRRRPDADLTAKLPQQGLSLCYLGSINNIINIPAITGLVDALSRQIPVTVHVIGRGERQEEFLQSLATTQAQVQFHGEVYDPQKKLEVLSACHFGLNIMKETVCVGLTMKSVDYFGHDLPIINNIPADTASLVEKYRVGVNLSEDTVEKLLAMSREEMLAMRENVHRMYDECFDVEVLRKKMEEILKGIV